ncbi:restriction endonuclease subunit S [Shewanella algae]|uniref:restriction endonuclease subunit S n=1 Tax=Shewanella algae TaxID=38313 RepID=UPI0031F57E6D
MTNLSGINLNNGSAVGAKREGMVSPSHSLALMPKYEAYKNSGEDWIGDIPEEWLLRRFKFLITEINERSQSGEENLLSVSQYTGVTNKSDKLGEGDLITNAESLEGYKKVTKGDLVSNIMLAWNGSLGVSPFDGITSPAYAVYRFGNECLDRFYHYLLRTELYKSEFKRRSTGVIESRLRLYTDDFFDVVGILPSLKEQLLIACFLDKKTAQIDDAIAIKDQQINLLKERKQIIIQQAVTQGLDPNVPMKDSCVDWIGKIPAHWDITKISNITNTTSGSTPQSGNVEAYYNGNIPWVRTTDLNDDLLFDTPEKITYKALRETSCKLVPENSVCVAMYGGAGTIGKHALLKFSGTVNQAVCAILPCHKLVPKFLYYYMKFYRPHWMIVAKGSRVDPNISQDQVRRMPITLPSIQEQTTIVDFINDQLGMFNDAEGFYLQQIEKLKEYKTTLINSAVTGKIKIIPEMIEH